MLIHFPSAVAVVLAVQLVVGVVEEIRVVLSCKFAIRLKQSRLIHRPLLNWRLFLLAVMLSVSSSSVWVKAITIGVKVVPCGKLGCFHEIPLVVCSMGTVCLMRESHWMLIKFGNRNHLIVISRMGEMILNKPKNTP